MSSFLKGVHYDHNGCVTSCVFCRIANHDPSEPSRIVTEDDRFISFIPLKGVHATHVLIVPKQHVKNVTTLKEPSASPEESAQLIKDMVHFAKTAAFPAQNLNVNPEEANYCFHVPPFNSIDHLHLHAIGKPKELSMRGHMKYLQGTYWCQSASSLIDELMSNANSRK